VNKGRSESEKVRGLRDGKKLRRAEAGKVRRKEG